MPTGLLVSEAGPERVSLGLPRRPQLRGRLLVAAMLDHTRGGEGSGAVSSRPGGDGMAWLRWEAYQPTSTSAPTSRIARKTIFSAPSIRLWPSAAPRRARTASTSHPVAVITQWAAPEVQAAPRAGGKSCCCGHREPAAGRQLIGDRHQRDHGQEVQAEGPARARQQPVDRALGAGVGGQVGCGASQPPAAHGCRRHCRARFGHLGFRVDHGDPPPSPRLGSAPGVRVQSQRRRGSPVSKSTSPASSARCSASNASMRASVCCSSSTRVVTRALAVSRRLDMRVPTW